MVDLGAVEGPTQAARVVGVLQGQGAIGGPVVGGDLVAGGVVGLDEDGMVPPGPRWPRREPSAPAATGAARADSPRAALAPKANRVSLSLLLLSRLIEAVRIQSRIGAKRYVVARAHCRWHLPVTFPVTSGTKRDVHAI